MKTCAEIYQCSPLDYINCSIFQSNTKCWLKGKGCLCRKDSTLECANCSIYHAHFNETLQLLDKARQKDSAALDNLIKEYKSFIYSIGNRFFLPGGTREDIFQEGFIGLYEAITKFDPTISNSFEKYASFCIRNSILSSLKKATQKKQKILNESSSIQESLGENGESRLSGHDDFESSLMLKLILENFMNNALCSLSAVESKVLIAKIAGYSNEEMCDMFLISKKQLENAIYRARNKMKELLTYSE